MTVILLLLLLLHQCVLAAALIFHSSFSRVQTKADTGHQKSVTRTPPRISILVAARNEAANILRCLEGLSALDYPKELLDIWIGNDQSEDRTEEIVRGFIADKPHFRLLTITEKLGQARGKSNVLAQLAHQARGEYFFVTDADCRVSPGWARAHLAELRQGAVFCSGTTIVEGTSLFARMQELEWLYLNLFWNAADASYPISAIGNNMAFPAKAYWNTGGYENHPFSVTEDYQLFLLLKKQGLRHRHLFSPECLVLSEPLNDYPALLRQRKRWLWGGTSMRWWVWGFLGLYSLFLPMWIALAFLAPMTAFVFMGMKFGLESALLLMGSRRLRLRFSLTDTLLFVPYLLVSNVLVFCYFFLPGRVKWKGRTY